MRGRSSAAGVPTEDFAEDIKGIVESGAVTARAGARARIEGGVAILVVSGPLLRIA